MSQAASPPQWLGDGARACNAIRPAHSDIVELSEIHHLLVPEPRYFPFDQSARAHCGIESQVGVWIAWTIIDEI